MFHQIYMQRCLDLASRAAGYTAPNPMVGAVVVCSGRIAGEGYHSQYGEPHAEVNAIRSVRDTDLLKHSTLYVNLEPCSHHGKQPPCSDFIIASGIPHVVTGSHDPNPKVSGRGIAMLRNAGVEVTEHVLERECDDINRRFMTFHRKQRPYILLKWAQTADGYIDIERDMTEIGRPTPVTGWYEQTLTHKQRSHEHAIMVGTNTAIADNPFLSVRRWNGHQPLRITLDRQLRLPPSLHIFDGSQHTFVFTEKERHDTEFISYITVPFDEQLTHRIANELYCRKIISVLIEGGTILLQSFIDCGLWDEVQIFSANKMFGNGIKAPVISKFKSSKVQKFKDSVIFEYINTP